MTYCVVAVPPNLERRIGQKLGRGRALPTKTTPSRVYFLIPLVALRTDDEDPWYRRDDVEVVWFDTREAAQRWGEADAARREVMTTTPRREKR